MSRSLDHAEKARQYLALAEIKSDDFDTRFMDAILSVAHGVAARLPEPIKLNSVSYAAVKVDEPEPTSPDPEEVVEPGWASEILAVLAKLSTRLTGLETQVSVLRNELRKPQPTIIPNKASPVWPYNPFTVNGAV